MRSCPHRLPWRPQSVSVTPPPGSWPRSARHLERIDRLVTDREILAAYRCSLPTRCLRRTGFRLRSCRSPQDMQAGTPRPRPTRRVHGHRARPEGPDWAIAGAPQPVTVEVDRMPQRRLAGVGLLSGCADVSRGTLRVRAPATSANIGPGYDSFGLALSLYDEIVVRVGRGGTRPRRGG